jgi:hypothetical protein
MQYRHKHKHDFCMKIANLVRFEVLLVVIIRMLSSGMLRCMALVRTDASEERTASIIRVTRIGELGTLAVTNN